MKEGCREMEGRWMNTRGVDDRSFGWYDPPKIVASHRQTIIFSSDDSQSLHIIVHYYLWPLLGNLDVVGI